MYEISVRPCAATKIWLVEVGPFEPMRFTSCAAAREAAQFLARRLHDTGAPACAVFKRSDGTVEQRVGAE